MENSIYTPIDDSHDLAEKLKFFKSMPIYIEKKSKKIQLDLVTTDGDLYFIIKNPQ